MFFFPGAVAALAVLATQVADPTGQAVVNSPTVLSGVDVEGRAEDTREDVRERQRPDEVICETRPVTGSRFNQRRCRTREQAAAARIEARRWMAEAVRSGPTTDAAASSGPPTGPQ
jgi:hypothetical protein